MNFIVSELKYNTPAVRVLDTEDTSVQDFTVTELVTYIKNGSIRIENAVVEKDSLRMINGSLDNYGTIEIGDTDDDDDIIEDAVVILEELINSKGKIVGYSIAMANGEMGEYYIEDMQKIAKEFRIANGTFTVENGVAFVSASEKPYPQVEVDDENAEQSFDEVPVTEDLSDKVIMRVLHEGKEHKTKVGVTELERAFSLIGYKGVIVTPMGNGDYVVTRGVPDELVTDANDVLLEIELPDNVVIGQNVFANSRNLRRVSIGSAKIGKGAFMMCTALTRLEMEGTEVIDDLAFFGCSALTELRLPNTLQEIGVSAFDGCGIVNLKVPSGVKTIKSLAFANCKALETATIPAEIMQAWPTGLRVFNNAVKSGTLGTDTVENMGIFMYCTALSKLNLKAQHILKIGDFQFKGCETLYTNARNNS